MFRGKRKVSCGIFLSKTSLLTISRLARDVIGCGELMRKQGLSQITSTSVELKTTDRCRAGGNHVRNPHISFLDEYETIQADISDSWYNLSI